MKLTSPQDGLQYITLGGVSEVPRLTLRATASDPDGEVVSVSFFDGDKLLTTLTQEPYVYELAELAKGDHKLRAVATDDEGRTGSTQVTVSVQEPTTNYLLHNAFTTEGSVPEGWVTYDGNERRVGFSSGYSSGSRVFHFTGTQRDFEWGLYTRNINGTARSGYARFADKATHTTLTLYPGNYQLMCRITNWNQASFSPVTVAVETAGGQEIWSETFTPTSNIGNSAANNFSGTTLKTLTFNVYEKERYVLTFYTADAPWADLVVGQAAIRRLGNVNAIMTPSAKAPADEKLFYNMNGQLVSHPVRGLYILGGKKVLIP